MNVQNVIDPIDQKITSSPKFKELVSRRKKFAMPLSLFVPVTYYAFMLTVAFAPHLLKLPFSSSGILSVGFPIGAAMMIVYWILTGWYVSRANTEFDALNEELSLIHI